MMERDTAYFRINRDVGLWSDQGQDYRSKKSQSDSRPREPPICCVLRRQGERGEWPKITISIDGASRK